MKEAGFSPPAARMTTALEGLRIIETTVGMAGAIAGMVFAENGAEVIRVDSLRARTSRDRPGPLVWHRGKKSVLLDLETPRGLEAVKRLVSAADGMIEDMAPGVAERIGVDYARLSAINPLLVYAKITGFGERGPLRDIPGYEHIVSAKSGRMVSQDGFRPGPVFTPTPIASYGAGMLAAQGLLAALYARQKTGRGQRVHTSLLHGLSAFDMGGFLHKIHRNDTAGPVHGTGPLGFMTALCKDGRYIQMCSRQPRLFRNWLTLLELEHLFDDPAFRHMPDIFPSREDMAALVEIIETKMRQKTVDEWLELFVKHDVGGDPFLTAGEFANHPQVIENGRRQSVIDPVVGETIQVGPLGYFAGTPSLVGGPAPQIGQHNAEVLGEMRVRKKPAAVPQAQRTLLKYPLEGVTAIECAYFYATPFSMTLLAELGARVIKIEPPEGDPMRKAWSGVYTKSASGKESVVLDLKHPKALESLHRLVAKADIFIHNFRPGVPEKLRIDYPALQAINPSLIYIYGSCYGSKGPWRRRPAFHSTPNALCGSGIIESGLGNVPRDYSFPDPVGALAVATCALVALHARERTGKGQYLETMMLASMACVLAPWNVQYKGKPTLPVVDKGQYGFHALHRLYETRDGWLFLMCPKEEHWSGLAGVLGAPGICADTRFATPEARRANDVALSQLIHTALQKRSAAEWEQRLLSAGVPGVRADAIAHDEFMLSHPQVKENGMVSQSELPAIGRFWRSAACYQFSDMGTRVAEPEPLGSRTAAVLREAGYSESEIDAMTREGVTKAVGYGLPAV